MKQLVQNKSCKSEEEEGINSAYEISKGIMQEVVKTSKQFKPQKRGET